MLDITKFPVRRTIINLPPNEIHVGDIVICPNGTWGRITVLELHPLGYIMWGFAKWQNGDWKGLVGMFTADCELGGGNEL